MLLLLLLLVLLFFFDVFDDDDDVFVVFRIIDGDDNYDCHDENDGDVGFSFSFVKSDASDYVYHKADYVCVVDIIGGVVVAGGVVF